MAHYDTDSTYVFLIIATHEYPQRVAFKCLGELKTAFVKNFGEVMHTCAEGGLSKRARPLLSEACAAYADEAKADKTIRVMRQVDEVRDIMQESITEMLATRENLEVLEDKTLMLRTEAAGFQRRAVTLRRNMWWRNCKMKMVCAFVVIVVLAYVFVPMIVQAMDASSER